MFYKFMYIAADGELRSAEYDAVEAKTVYNRLKKSSRPFMVAKYDYGIEEMQGFNGFEANAVGIYGDALDALPEAVSEKIDAFMAEHPESFDAPLEDFELTRYASCYKLRIQIGCDIYYRGVWFLYISLTGETSVEF